MRNIDVAGGTLEAGPGWERDGETSIVRRALRMDVRLAHRSVVSPPMRHLSVCALAECPIALLARLRSKLRSRVPGLSVVDEGPFAFSDGTLGEYLSLEMELLPGMRSRQLHVVRADGGVTRHFVATVTAAEAPAIGAELAPMIASFELAARKLAV